MIVDCRNCDPEWFQHLLEQKYLPSSRFKVNELTVGRIKYYRGGHQTVLKIMGVRLKRKKDYCGQHAGPCLAQNAWRPHKVTSYLEGSDWVAWNDMLNDLCDANKIEAVIFSTRESIGGPLYLRKGKARCINYQEAAVGQHWDGKQPDSVFSEEHFGKRKPAARADYPDGTPGIPEYLQAKEDEYFAREVTHAH